MVGKRYSKIASKGGTILRIDPKQSVNISKETLLQNDMDPVSVNINPPILRREISRTYVSNDPAFVMFSQGLTLDHTVVPFADSLTDALDFYQPRPGRTNER